MVSVIERFTKEPERTVDSDQDSLFGAYETIAISFPKAVEETANKVSPLLYKLLYIASMASDMAAEERPFANPEQDVPWMEELAEKQYQQSTIPDIHLMMADGI